MTLLSGIALGLCWATVSPAVGDGRLAAATASAAEAPRTHPELENAIASIDGVARVVPRLGRAAWKSVVLAPFTGEMTTLLALEAAGGLESQVYMYSGVRAPDSADPAERSGLSEGSLFVLAAAGELRWSEADTLRRGQSMPARWVSVPWAGTALELQAAAVAANSLDFARVEGGAFDTVTPGIFYFVTTGRGAAVNPYGRLYRLDFDPADPAARAMLTLLLDGSEGVVSPESVAINAHGELAICERPNYRLSTIGLTRGPSVWVYAVATSALNRIAESDATVGSPEFIGVTDAESRLGRGSWLVGIRDGARTRSLQLVWRPPDGD